MGHHQRVEITMASRVELLNLLHAASDEVCRFLHLDEDTAMNLGLALHEAAVNAIRHGNRLDAAKEVTVTFSMHAAGLEITVRDQGNGFDEGAVPDPLSPANINRTSGRGIFLMKNFVDRVEFRHTAGQGTTVTLFKRLPGRDRHRETEG